MSPETLSIVDKLLSMGGQAGILFAAVYILARTLKSQYESRITSLEVHVTECDRHRAELGAEMRAMQNQRIDILEHLLEGKAPR